MPMMSDQDWQSWRDTARQTTQNMNALPFVFNPTDATSDRTTNQQMLYGLPQGSTDITAAIKRAFQQYYGHQPNDGDIAAWLQGAQTNNLTPQQVIDAIGASANNPANATLHGATDRSAGQTMPGAMNPASGFTTGTMGNTIPMPFNTGMMGYR